jgi:hypothetical protein
LTVGQVVPLSASVTLPSGGQKQIADASWQSSNAGVATVSSTGVVTVTGFGVADIFARAYGQSATTRAFAPAPPQIQLTVRIDQHGSTVGMCGVTNTTFDLTGSSGTGLRYAMSYGDSASAAASVSRHVFACPAIRPAWPYTRTYSVRATVTDVLDRTDVANATVTVLDRLDRMPPSIWNSLAWSSRFLMFKNQTGVAVSGFYESGDDPTYSWRPFSGTLTGDNDLEMGLTDGSIHMSGYLILQDDLFASRIVLTFRGGSADSRTLQFYPYDSY